MSRAATSAQLRSPNDPMISVVVISYEHEPFLEECLDSLIAQTLQPYEIIVCDDCSGDGSWEVIRTVAERHPNLVIPYRHATNIGHIANGSFARSKVRGELFSVIDGDDRWAPTKLEAEWSAMRTNKDSGVAFSNVRGIDSRGASKEVWHDGPGMPAAPEELLIKSFARQLFPKTQSAFRNELVATRVTRTIGQLDPEIPIHVDWDLKLRLAANYRIAYADNVTVDYRTHDSNMNARTTHEQRLDSMRRVVSKNRLQLQRFEPHERAYVLDHLAFLGELP